MPAAGHPSPEAPVEPVGDDGRIRVEFVARTLRGLVEGRPVSLLRLPFAWQTRWWPHRHPLDYLGKDGGAGVGSGPGTAVGGALALRGSGRLPVAVLGDGDYLMGLTALWTAARHDLPLLVIVANNTSYFNDEIHQDEVARQRGRPVGNRTVGLRISEPVPDLAMLARGQGVAGFGPVTDPGDLRDTLVRALQVVDGGRPAVVDVHVERAYPQATRTGLTSAP